MNAYLSRTHLIIIITLVLALLFLVEPASIAYAQDAPPTTAPPAEIPEPITIILFGTGLAALSALSALRRSKSD